MPTTLIGILLGSIAALLLLAHRRERRAVCADCGSPYCHGGSCIKRAAWDAEQREALALTKIDAALIALNEPLDALEPWRELLERL